jgi:glycosyltransferase involved in cell wall biosynthesis
MVVRNEASRYLRPMLRHFAELTDQIVVVDDRSDDDTVTIAQAAGCTVGLRRVDAPSFETDESAFRQAAWELMVDTAQPTVNDWIIALDADEFLQVRDRAHLESLLADAPDCLNVPVDEVFAMSNGTPLIRVDGLWASIRATRILRWRAGDSRFRPYRQGGGSVPMADQIRARFFPGLRILHMGYARPEDRAIKHARYTATPGHSTQHVSSILSAPRLRELHCP